MSVINAYYWNDKYVFAEDEEEARIWWRTLIKTFMAYAGTGLILNNLLLVFWVRVGGIHEMLGPVINVIITTPINFLINKLWAYCKRTNK